MFILAVWIAADSEYVKYCTIYHISNVHGIWRNVSNNASNIHYVWQNVCNVSNLHDASRNVCNIYRNSCNISHNIKSVILIVLLILAAVNMRYVHPKGLYIMMLDVGQGDCLYIRDETGICSMVEARMLNRQESTGYIKLCVIWVYGG